MRRLHEVPRFSDRWSHLYLEHGRLDCESGALVFHDADGDHQVPIDQLALLMLGPGTTVTQASMRALAENSCMVSWVGDHGVRTYAHSTGSTFSAKRLLTQARLLSIAVFQRLILAFMAFATRPLFPQGIPRHSVSFMSEKCLVLYMISRIYTNLK